MSYQAYSLPRTLAGTGTAWLHCKVGVAEHFKLDQLPSPEDHGLEDPVTGDRFIPWPRKPSGANNFNLRIAYAWPDGKRKPLMSRFRLSGNPILETVQVLTNHLNSVEVDWLWIANANGGKLSRSAFHSDALYGRGRACS